MSQFVKLFERIRNADHDGPDLPELEHRAQVAYVHSIQCVENYAGRPRVVVVVMQQDGTLARHVFNVDSSEQRSYYDQRQLMGLLGAAGLPMIQHDVDLTQAALDGLRGVPVHLDFVERQSGTRTYTNLTCRRVSYHQADVVRRVLEWDDARGEVLERALGEAERGMFACEEGGDPKYADRWAELVSWIQSRMREVVA